MSLAVALLTLGSESANRASAAPMIQSNTGESTYVNDRYDFSAQLPDGWREATQFMRGFAATGGGAQGGAPADQYVVLTGVSAGQEQTLVTEATNTPPTGITGMEPWLEFFLLDSVQIFPTERDVTDLLRSSDSGNVKYLVTNVRDVTAGTIPAKRYTLELVSDYGHYIYDTVFVPPSPSGVVTLVIRYNASSV